MLLLKLGIGMELEKEKWDYDSIIGGDMKMGPFNKILFPAFTFRSFDSHTV
jgi:hypothetical protein